MLTGGQETASKNGDWSETYICNLFDWHLKEQETMDWLAGTAQWVFKDFSAPQRPENPLPRVNQKGVVERDMTLKEGYFVFQSYWAEQPMVRIYGHSWPVRWGKPDESKLVKAYSNCPSVELFVNGSSAGVRKRNSQDFPAAGLRWLVKFKDGENVIKAVGIKDGASVTDTTSFSYQTKSWRTPSKLVLEELDRDGDKITVRSKLLDHDGVPCLDSRKVVRFGLTGDGRLLDNLGTSTGSRRLELYNGCAAINVQLKSGTAIVSISSEGLETGFLKLKSAASNTWP
jgi:beta-galactosidase